MATVQCRKCGRIWSDEITPEYTCSQFATPSFAAGSYPSVAQIVASGEHLFACSADPQEPLDAAMQDKSSGPRSSARITGVSSQGASRWVR